MVLQCWASVADSGPVLNQYNILYLVWTVEIFKMLHLTIKARLLERSSILD